MNFVCLLPLCILILIVCGVLFGLVFQLPFSQIAADFAMDEILFALKLSLTTSAAATFLTVVLGVPSGYFLSRNTFKGKIVIEALIDLPMTMPPLVAGVGLLFLLSNTTVQRCLNILNIELLFSVWGAVLAQVLITAPIMTRTSKSAFASLDKRYEQAAQTLGLNSFQIFFHVAFPMARPIILSGIVLCWARAVGEFGATLMVAGATRFKTETLPIAVFLNISSGEMGIALVCAWMLIMTGFGVLFLMRWIGPPMWSKHLGDKGAMHDGNSIG